jgi:hypothetical protein
MPNIHQLAAEVRRARGGDIDAAYRYLRLSRAYGTSERGWDFLEFAGEARRSALRNGLALQRRLSGGRSGR